MLLFGLEPVEIVLIICIVGVVLRVWVGKMKNPGTKFNVNAVILTFLVGLIASVGIVAPTISTIPDDTDKIVMLPILAGQVIIVMKSESLSTSLKKLIPSKSNNTPKVTGPFE